MSEEHDDDAATFARDFAERRAGLFRVLRRTLDLSILALMIAWLMGRVTPGPILAVIVVRLLLPMAFGWMAGREFGQRHRDRSEPPPQ